MKMTRWIIVGLMGLALSSAASLAWSFTATQTEYVTMSVVLGQSQIDPTQLQIVHTPLQGISNITKLALIQGKIGTGLISSQSIGTPVKSSGANPVLRLTLRYALDAGDVTTVVQTFDSDPAAFQFQIDPAQIHPGTFQYQLIGEKLNSAGAVLSTASIPADAFGSPNSFLTLGINAAGAAPIFGPSGGVITIADGNPNDGQSTLIIPSGVLKAPTQVSLNEIALTDSQVPSVGSLPPAVAYYRLDADPPFQGGVRLSLLYPEYKPSVSGWNIAGEKLNTSQLSVAIWDGFAWRFLNGRVDTTTHLLTMRTGNVNYLGVFPAGAPSVESIAPPQKIITPNGDGMNDTADFTGIGSGTTVELYDVTGHKVRTMTGPNNLTWDGRDDKGQIVESGVYIYQFSENGQRISGVIAVAK